MHVGFDLWHYTVFVEKFPSLLRPIFKLQEELRARSGKLKFWQVATDNRTLVLENGEEATIGGMIMAHTRSAMREKLENGMDSDDESEESEVDEWGLPKEKVGKQDLAQMGCWAARKEVKRRKRKEKAARSRKQGIYDISEVGTRTDVSIEVDVEGPGSVAAVVVGCGGCSGCCDGGCGGDRVRDC